MLFGKYKEGSKLFVITLSSLVDFFSSDFVQRTDYVGPYNL